MVDHSRLSSQCRTPTLPECEDSQAELMDCMLLYAGEAAHQAQHAFQISNVNKLDSLYSGFDCFLPVSQSSSRVSYVIPPLFLTATKKAHLNMDSMPCHRQDSVGRICFRSVPLLVSALVISGYKTASLHQNLVTELAQLSLNFAQKSAHDKNSFM